MSEMKRDIRTSSNSQRVDKRYILESVVSKWLSEELQIPE